jgi:hypothetical protein
MPSFNTVGAVEARLNAPELKRLKTGDKRDAKRDMRMRHRIDPNLIRRGLKR